MEATEEHQPRAVMEASRVQPEQVTADEEQPVMHIERLTTPDGRRLLLYTFAEPDDE